LRATFYTVAGGFHAVIMAIDIPPPRGPRVEVGRKIYHYQCRYVWPGGRGRLGSEISRPSSIAPAVNDGSGAVAGTGHEKDDGAFYQGK